MLPPTICAYTKWMQKDGYEHPYGANGEGRHSGSQLSRRSFLTTVLAIGGVCAAASVMGASSAMPSPVPSVPRISPSRNTPIVPPGAGSLASYRVRCTGCQLCVAACSNQVLRIMGTGMSLLQPVLSFERGACRHDCVACSLVCPTEAIRPVTTRVKNSTQIGRARLLPDVCIAVTEKEPCTECARNCPTGAIVLLDHNEARIPTVDEERCTGCGSCEFHCPVRPHSAMLVEGNSVHLRV